jgi:hypothetical protein
VSDLHRHAASMVLIGAMKHPSLLQLTVISTLFATPAFAQGDSCLDCKEVAPPMTDRERIKAERDKFDREMKLDTKRPWDGDPYGILRRTPPPTPVPK